MSLRLESNFGCSCQDLQSSLTNSTHPNTLKGIWFWWWSLSRIASHKALLLPAALLHAAGVEQPRSSLKSLLSEIKLDGECGRDTIKATSMNMKALLPPAKINLRVRGRHSLRGRSTAVYSDKSWRRRDDLNATSIEAEAVERQEKSCYRVTSEAAEAGAGLSSHSTDALFSAN